MEFCLIPQIHNVLTPAVLHSWKAVNALPESIGSGTITFTFPYAGYFTVQSATRNPSQDTAYLAPCAFDIVML